MLSVEVDPIVRKWVFLRSCTDGVIAVPTECFSGVLVQGGELFPGLGLAFSTGRTHLDVFQHEEGSSISNSVAYGSWNVDGLGVRHFLQG